MQCNYMFYIRKDQGNILVAFKISNEKNYVLCGSNLIRNKKLWNTVFFNYKLPFFQFCLCITSFSFWEKERMLILSVFCKIEGYKLQFHPVCIHWIYSTLVDLFAICPMYDLITISWIPLKKLIIWFLFHCFFYHIPIFCKANVTFYVQ